MVTLKYNYLIKRKHKISNLFMLPKLHKSKQINEIIQKQQCEYIPPPFLLVPFTTPAPY